MPIHKIVMNSDLHGSAGQCLIHQTIASFLKSKKTGMHLLKQMYALSNHDLWKVENHFQFHNPFKMLTPFFFGKQKNTFIPLYRQILWNSVFQSQLPEIARE